MVTDRTYWTSCGVILLVAALFLVIGIWSGCSDDDQGPKPVPRVEGTFVGELLLDIVPDTVGRRTTDTVRLAVVGTRFDLIMLTNRPNLCDVGGQVSGFGGTSARFTVTDTFPSQCDSVHVLRGTFPTQFKGDSLIMIRYDAVRDTQFEFRLRRQ